MKRNLNRTTRWRTCASLSQLNLTTLLSRLASSSPGGDWPAGLLRVPQGGAGVGAGGALERKVLRRHALLKTRAGVSLENYDFAARPSSPRCVKELLTCRFVEKAQRHPRGPPLHGKTTSRALSTRHCQRGMPSTTIALDDPRDASCSHATTLRGSSSRLERPDLLILR